MAKRIIVKPGDIFCIELDTDKKCYFQYLTKDIEQLNSDVIRVFKTIYPKNIEPTYEEIVSDEISFHVHTFVNFWAKKGYWNKVGKAVIEKGACNIYFKTYEEDDKKTEWRIWKVNKYDRFCKWITKRLYEKAEWGEVVPAKNVIQKITNGFLIKYLYEMEQDYKNGKKNMGIISLFDIFKKKK